MFEVYWSNTQLWLVRSEAYVRLVEVSVGVFEGLEVANVVERSREEFVVYFLVDFPVEPPNLGNTVVELERVRGS